MERYLNKKCRYAIEINRKEFFYLGKLLEVTPTHIVFWDDKDNKAYTFRRDKILEITEVRE